MYIYPSITDRLRTQHHAIENILSTIDQERLQIRPQPNKWNIHDNIAHLARYQPVFIERLNQILLSEEPSFGRYNAEEDPAFENWRTLDTHQLIKQLNEDRNSIYNQVNDLTDTEINRIGIHKKYGPLNI